MERQAVAAKSLPRRFLAPALPMRSIGSGQATQVSLALPCVMRRVFRRCRCRSAWWWWSTRLTAPRRGESTGGQAGGQGRQAGRPCPHVRPHVPSLTSSHAERLRCLAGSGHPLRAHIACAPCFGWLRPEWVIDSTYELFMDLGASDELCEFPVVYASGENERLPYEVSRTTDSSVRIRRRALGAAAALPNVLARARGPLPPSSAKPFPP
jgi:hypothetical protein